MVHEMLVRENRPSQQSRGRFKRKILRTGWKPCAGSVDYSSRRRGDRARSSMPRRAVRGAGSKARRRLEPPLCNPLARRRAVNRHIHHAFTRRAWPPRAPLASRRRLDRANRSNSSALITRATLGLGGFRSTSADALADCFDRRVSGCLNFLADCFDRRVYGCLNFWMSEFLYPLSGATGTQGICCCLPTPSRSARI
jgi:hypothetical protein